MTKKTMPDLSGDPWDWQRTYEAGDAVTRAGYWLAIDENTDSPPAPGNGDWSAIGGLPRPLAPASLDVGFSMQILTFADTRPVLIDPAPLARASFGITGTLTTPTLTCTPGLITADLHVGLVNLPPAPVSMQVVGQLKVMNTARSEELWLSGDITGTPGDSALQWVAASAMVSAISGTDLSWDESDGAHVSTTAGGDFAVIFHYEVYWLG